MAIVTTKVVKNSWLTAMACKSKAWLELRERSSPLGEADLFRMEQGREIGELAQKLFPGGRLVQKEGGKSAVELTQELVAGGSTESLFEAAFLDDPFVAKADILTRRDGGWHLLEVKSSFSDTSSLGELIDDLTYTALVLRRAGVEVERYSLLLLSRKYRFGDGPERLFEFVDVSSQVESKVKDFEGAAEVVAKELFADSRPEPVLVSECRNCSFFDSKCLGAGIERTVLELPSLHYTKLKRLSGERIIDLAKVPDDLKLNERQERAKYSALTGNVVVEPGLGAALESINWPCHYLDFETVATVLPLYEGNGCHQQILTQFSAHHRDSIDAEVRHSEYLADAARDCERELAEELIKALGQDGSIVVYSGFEKTRIKALQERFPDLAPQLQSILDRVLDLLPVVMDNVYHPEFRGSFSIKAVLPALIPDLSYKGLAVADGDTAITRFARMARGEIVGARIDSTRQELLEYCKLDTYAMVRLHEVLSARATARQRAGGG